MNNNNLFKYLAMFLIVLAIVYIFIKILPILIILCGVAAIFFVGYNLIEIRSGRKTYEEVKLEVTNKFAEVVKYFSK